LNVAERFQLTVLQKLSGHGLEEERLGVLGSIRHQVSVSENALKKTMYGSFNS